VSAPASPSAPATPGAPGAPASQAAPAASGSPSAAAAPSSPGSPSAPGTTAVDDQAKAKRLSGKHWQATASQKWPESSRIEDLSDEFRPKAQAFIAMLSDNKIQVDVASTKRPTERAYLYHYCLDVAAGRVDAADVPKLATVDIEWDHGDADKSKAAAQEMADAFGLVGVAAYPSNHSGGNALDMKMDFSGNTKDGKNAVAYKKSPGDEETKRELKVDDEAVIGTSARGKNIPGIANRTLSLAGKDYGVIRAINNDIVHWSSTGG
jgi:hypothetical protein